MSYLSKHMTPLGFKFHGDNGPGDKIKEKLEKAKAALKAKTEKIGEKINEVKEEVKSNKEEKNKSQEAYDRMKEKGLLKYGK